MHENKEARGSRVSVNYFVLICAIGLLEPSMLNKFLNEWFTLFLWNRI